MDYSIPTLTIAFLGVSAFICLVGLIVLWLSLRLRVLLRQIIAGFVTYMVFAYFIESFMTGAIGSAGLAPAAHVALVGLSAAILEELSRFVMMKFMLKNESDCADAALGFGLGFSIFEVVGVGVNALMTLPVAMTFNSSGFDQLLSEMGQESLDGITAEITTLATTPSYYYLLGGINRIFFTAEHMALSVIVWYAVRKSDRRWLLPVAVVLNFLAAAPSLMFAQGIISDKLHAEIAYYLVAAAITAIGLWLFKKYEQPYYTKLRGDRLRARTRR